MKIVDRKTFLSMPAGTVFSTFEPHVFGELMIKGDSYTNDFVEQPIADAIESFNSYQFYDKLNAAIRDGTSLTMDFDCAGRNGLFDDGLFAVWEPQDVQALIKRLHMALFESTYVPTKESFQ